MPFPSLCAVYCIRSSQVLDIKCLPINRSAQNMIDVAQTVLGFKLQLWSGRSPPKWTNQAESILSLL